MNQPTAKPSDLAGLDDDMRLLIKDTLPSTRLVNRYVLSQYLPSNTHGVNRVLLAGALSGSRG